MSTIEGSLSAVSLMFTVLTFFVTLRVNVFDLSKLKGIAASSIVAAAIDLLLAAAAGFVLAIIWPLMHNAFAGFASAENVLPNLLGVIAIGFGLLGLVEAGIAAARCVYMIKNT